MGCLNSKTGAQSSGTVIVSSTIVKTGKNEKVKEWLDSDADVSNGTIAPPIEVI